MCHTIQQKHKFKKRYLKLPNNLTLIIQLQQGNNNKDGGDQYGNDGFVSQGVSKEARDKGEKGKIVGNYKKIHRPEAPQAKPAAKAKVPHEPDQDDDVPF